MRIAVAMLICMGVGSMARAELPPPAPPAAAAPGLTAPSAAATESDKTPAPAQLAPASAAATPPSASASAPPTEGSPKPAAAADPREKQLKAKGYRLETRNGEKVYCKTEQELGSRIATKKICGTIDELQGREQNYKDAAQSAQQHQLNPLGN